MGDVDWPSLISMIVAVLIMLASFGKWFIDWAEKRDQVQETHFNERIEQHDEEFKLVHERIDKHVDELSETREKMHNDFVKQTDLQRIHVEDQDNFKLLFEKIAVVNKALNQLIGAINGKVKDG